MSTIIQVSGSEVAQIPFLPISMGGGGGGGLTTEEVDDRVAVLIVAGTGITKAYNDGANTLTISVTASTYQPLDIDLTAIAALTTTTFGRSLLTLADAAALSAAHTHTLSQISDITVSSSMVVTTSLGIRPGLFDELTSPPVGTMIESSNDGHLYWIHRDGSVHLLCDSGGYGDCCAPRNYTAASTATLTIDAAATDIAILTAQAAALTIAAPTGSPVAGQKLIIRIKDNSTARALTWNAIWRVIGTTLPTTTVVSKTHYIGAMYNATDAKWDVLAVGVQA